MLKKVLLHTNFLTAKNLVVLFFILSKSLLSQTFIHPGLLHSSNDLAFIKKMVAEKKEPWQAAYIKLNEEKISKLTWVAKPVENVVRGPYNKPDIGSSALMNDSATAYSQCLQWHITGDKVHAEKALHYLRVWADKLKSIEGSDQQLLAGITGYKWCNALELLQAFQGGVEESDLKQLKRMLYEVYYPLIKDFKPKSNGNWDASMILTMMSIGIVFDDRVLYDRATEYFLKGEGNGSIGHYIYPSGQCQESTRDQAHTQLGLGFLAAACETAKHQGLDLYGAEDNRLMKGFEYTAKYNLGNEVECEGTISEKFRGTFRPIYEKVYQHYAVAKGLPMPFTKQVVEKNRPEGWSADHESWGTLTYYRAEAKE